MRRLLIKVVTISVLATRAHGRIILPTSRSATIPSPHSSLNNAHGILGQPGLHNIRGGGAVTSKEKHNQHDITTRNSPNPHIQAILIPRQTSILTPLRFLSFLLMNISFNYCMQTAGKPMEDAVRRILNMPLGNDFSAPKVNQLHVYMAKKLLSSSSTSVELLPPAHLPSPTPLLGLFLSIMLYIGGTILAPKWSVHVDAFFNYDRFDLDDNATISDVTEMLWNWFDQQNQDDADVYYQTKKSLAPAVLVHDQPIDSEEAAMNGVICPLFLSPENDDNPEEGTSDCGYHYLGHPRRYYFEFNGKRHYYDPIYQSDLSSTLPALICGGPNLHELPISKLLSPEYTNGLNTESKLSKAQERYESYSHISLPIPTLSEAFISRVSSPLVALQVVGRLLSVLEDETIGKSLANLGRLVSQHLFDTKRSIEAAAALASEVEDNEDSGHKSCCVRIWAVRPADNDESGIWVEVQSNEILPGDVFTITSTSGSSYFLSGAAMPVDCLLLEGNCVTEEAALTGESVPQAKIPLEEVDEFSNLDMNGQHRSSCLFAGTKLLHCTNDGSDSDASLFHQLPSIPRGLETSNPALFLSLRAGYYSTKGEIIQSLVKSKTNLGTVSSRERQIDQMRLFGGLSVFSAIICCHLILGSKSDSLFKRIVQCTRVVAASVPSDLPVSLSALARECSHVLRDESDALCSNPEALLESSKIDCIVFDKTGTLTSDTQSLLSIQHCQPSHSRKHDDSEDKLVSQIVLAGSNTLVGMNGTLIGDPLDKACLASTGWSYDPESKIAVDGNGTKLWQLRSFPFDPKEQMSSAIVLVRNNGTYNLWIVIKGASAKLQDLVDVDSTHWLAGETSRLGGLGYRTICLAAWNASESPVTSELFLSGLPKQGDSTRLVNHLVQEARNRARNIHRKDVERHPSQSFGSKPMISLASFDAPVRASTSRVINELNQANIDLKMLTGDDISTSLSVAKKTGIIPECENIYWLKVNHFGSLVLKYGKNEVRLTSSTARKMLHDLRTMTGVLAVHGNAVKTALLFNKTDKSAKYARDILPRAALITNASPDDKYLFINWLHHHGKHVLMCGDGVNDIAAMTEADVSCAMMSGFGDTAGTDENITTVNIDDAVRIERLKQRRIGSNRLISSRSDVISDEEQIGIGKSPMAASFRIQKRISEQIKDQQLDASTTPLSIVMASIKEEFDRYRHLKKGGSAAAKIIAEEDRLRQSLQEKAGIKGGGIVQKSSKDNEAPFIKTGEACLASSFTLMRPSIAAVETILRTGIASASSSIALYRKIILNCILSCYNLATVYKNGLRYGKWMWQCELFGILYTDKASFEASSMPRPRLVANTRPPTSPINLADIGSLALQAIVHIVTLTLAVVQGKQLEASSTQQTQNGFRLKWTSRTSEKGSVGAVLASLDHSESTLSSQEPGPALNGLLRRSPFRPNHVSNNVFIMSVFQNAVIGLVNHQGKPFSLAFFESRPLCLSVGLSIMFCIVFITETLPLLNNCIQLAPFPSKASKVALLRLLLFDIALTYFAEYTITFLFRRDIWATRNAKPVRREPGRMSASDQEDNLLEQERAGNVSIVCLMFVCGCSLLLNHLTL